MSSRLLATLGILVYAVAIPILEVNNTHVFNTQWPSHARLHEVWQLLTNSSIGALSLWLIWRKNEVRLSSILGLCLSGSFLLAFVMRASYGGSMDYMKGPEPSLFGLDIGVLGVGIVFALFVSALISRLGRPG